MVIAIAGRGALTLFLEHFRHGSYEGKNVTAWDSNLTLSYQCGLVDASTVSPDCLRLVSDFPTG